MAADDRLSTTDVSSRWRDGAQLALASSAVRTAAHNLSLLLSCC